MNFKHFIRHELKYIYIYSYNINIIMKYILYKYFLNIINLLSENTILFNLKMLKNHNLRHYIVIFVFIM